MSRFSAAVIAAVERTPEVQLTTFGRRSGSPYRVIVWAYTDGERVFVRSGGGLGRDWPRNLLAGARGILHVEEHDVPVHAIHVTDPSESRRIGALARAKYGATIAISNDAEPLTDAEGATFALTAAIREDEPRGNR